MTLHTDAFAELDRELRFFPLGVDDPRTLSREQIAHYNEKGYVYPIAPARATRRPAGVSALEQLDDWHKHCRGVWA